MTIGVGQCLAWRGKAMTFPVPSRLRIGWLTTWRQARCKPSGDTRHPADTLLGTCTWRMPRPIPALTFTVLLAGCIVGPDYIPEPAPVPLTFKEAKGWKLAT